MRTACGKARVETVRPALTTLLYRGRYLTLRLTRTHEALTHIRGDLRIYVLKVSIYLKQTKRILYILNFLI